MDDRVKHSLRYAAAKGFREQSYLLDCVRKGLSCDIEAVFSSDEHVDQMEDIFGNDVSFAKMVFSFIWPKIVYVADEGGCLEPSAAEEYPKYYHNLQHATSISSILEMNKQFFVKFAEKVALSATESSLSPLVRRIHRYINAHINEKIAVSRIAEKLRLSRSYLSHVYKRETGRTITDGILHRKILEAKRLIQYSSLSFTDIGSKLGFCSQSHFISVFRKEIGMTPLQYCRSCEEKLGRYKPMDAKTP